GRHEELSRLRWVVAQGDVEGRSAELRRHELAEPLVAVLRDGVSHLMPQDDRQAVLVPGDGEQSGEHHDLASREHERIRLLALDYVEFPLVALEQLRLALPLQGDLSRQGEALADTPNGFHHLRILRHLALFEEGLVLRSTHLFELPWRKELQGTPPGEGRRCAGRHGEQDGGPRDEPPADLAERRFEVSAHLPWNGRSRPGQDTRCAE